MASCFAHNDVVVGQHTGYIRSELNSFVYEEIICSIEINVLILKINKKSEEDRL